MSVKATTSYVFILAYFSNFVNSTTNI